MFSILFPTVTLLVVSTYASPTPKTSNPAHLNHLEARQCGFAGWDSSNLDNWKAADTDAVFEKWWQTYLGGNSDTTSSVIPNGWPNRFVGHFILHAIHITDHIPGKSLWSNVSERQRSLRMFQNNRRVL